MTSHIITAGGKRVELPVNEEGARQHFSWPGSYTDEILRQINDARCYAPILDGKRDLIMFDIGANVGLVAIHAYDVCRKIVAVEPSDHFPLLCKLTSPYPNIFPIQAALHPRDEPVSLCLCDQNSTAHSTVVPVGGRSMTVNGQRLSTLLKPHLCDPGSGGHVGFECLVKVDVEGAEMVSLTESEISQVRDSVATFYVEAHPWGGGGYPENRDILKRRFESQGYSVETPDHQSIIARRR